MMNLQVKLQVHVEHQPLRTYTTTSLALMFILSGRMTRGMNQLPMRISTPDLSSLPGCNFHHTAPSRETMYS